MYNINYIKSCDKANKIIKFIGRKYYIKLMNKYLYNNKNKKSDKYVIRWRKLYTYDKDIFKEKIYVPFENIKIPIPKNYERYFDVDYGENWFVYPLVEERKDTDRIFNLYVPYNLYQNDFLSFIDKDKIIEAYKVLKNMKMKRIGLDKKVEDSKIRNQFYKDKLELEEEININNVNQLFKKNKYGEIRKYLNKYYYLQLKGSLRDKNLIFFSDEEFLYNTIFTLIMTDEFYDARKLLNIKSIKEILSCQYDSLMNLMDNSKEIYKAKKQKVDELYKLYPYSLTFAVQYFKYLKDNKEKTEVIKIIDEIYSDFGQIYYLKGLLKYENNQIKEAKDLLNLAKEKTRNGLIIYDIDKKLKEIEKQKVV